MPELPEVERVRRSIERSVLGLTVRSVTVHRRDVVTGPDDPQGGWSRASEAARSARKPRVDRAMLLEGSRILSVQRHGKQLAIEGDRGAAGVHLGMSGQVVFRGPGQRLDRADHVHLTWTLVDSSGNPAGRLVFRDPRRFGGVWAHASLEDLRDRRWTVLGPDALAIRGDLLAERLGPNRAASGPVRCVKAALLDQATIAGVGNIYADEALHLAGIRPERRVNRLERPEIDRLATELRRVLSAAIEAGGSTLRDYVDSDGTRGGFQLQHRVYGRSGQMCTQCGKPLLAGTVAQRATVWCGFCQR